jgi:hypothetical protein
LDDEEELLDPRLDKEGIEKIANGSGPHARLNLVIEPQGDVAAELIADENMLTMRRIR